MRKLFLILLLVSIFVESACTSINKNLTPSSIPTATEFIIPTSPTPEPGCTTVNVKPTPGPESPSLFPPINDADHSIGVRDAQVTLLIYNDFQCVECNISLQIQRLLDGHPDEIRVVYRHYPFAMVFDKSIVAAQAAEAAATQGKFWEMHNLLFEQQSEWIELSSEAFESWIITQAAELKLDSTQFKEDFYSTKTIEKVQEAANKGQEMGIPKLPFLLINGQVYNGPLSYEALDQIINLIALGERQFSECPPIKIDTQKQYIATLKTEKGDIVLTLYAKKAPLAVNSFIFLAEQGWYDGVTFHRVIPDLVAQTGDPSGTGQGNPGYMFDNEIDPTLTFDQAGIVGMANSGPNTNGSQFFITYAAAPHLNGSYTIFGRVISGMNVLEQLTPRNPQPGESLPPGDRLISITIEEK